MQKLTIRYAMFFNDIYILTLNYFCSRVAQFHRSNFWDDEFINIQVNFFYCLDLSTRYFGTYQKIGSLLILSNSFLDFSAVFVSCFARVSRSLSSTSHLVLLLMVPLLRSDRYCTVCRLLDASYHTVSSTFICVFGISSSFTD